MCYGVERALQFFAAPFFGNLSDAKGRKGVSGHVVLGVYVVSRSWMWYKCHKGVV